MSIGCAASTCPPNVRRRCRELRDIVMRTKAPKTLGSGRPRSATTARGRRVACRPRCPLPFVQNLFEVMQHIQDIWILLMASEQTTALSEFGHQPGVIHVTPALSPARTPGRYFPVYRDDAKR